MALEAHLQELKSKHHTLDEKIQSELRTPLPDNIHLASLKKQKLYLKEQIASLTQ